MAYLLIVPICLYAILAARALVRKPRSLPAPRESLLPALLVTVPGVLMALLAAFSARSWLIAAVGLAYLPAVTLLVVLITRAATLDDLLNSRLLAHEHEQRHVAGVLREAAGALTTRTLDDVFDHLLELLHQVVDYERATVLLNAEPGTLRIRASAGFRDNPDPEQLDQVRITIDTFPNLKRLFTENASILVADTMHDSNWVKREYEYRSWIGAPLSIHNRVLGCLSLTHTQANHFTEAELQTATAFAAQVAIVAENAHLLETEQQRRAHAERMQQASLGLVTSPDLERALQATLDGLARMVQFDRAHIGLIDEDGETWSYHAGYPPFGAESGPDALPPLSHCPLMRQVMDQKQPILVPETRANSLWQSCSLTERESRCWLGVPLLVRDRIIGLINLTAFRPHAFAQDHVQNVQVFANQVAAALDNFRLVEQTRRQNHALSTLNTVLAASNEALTHDNMLGVMLERLLEALQLRAGLIHQYHAAAQELRLRAVSGLTEPVSPELRAIPVQLTLPSDLQPLVSLNHRTLPPVTLANGDTCDFISVPLVSHGIEIGLLSIAQSEDAPITAETRVLLANIGQQLGVIMDNAALFEDSTRRVLLSTDLGRLSLALSTQLERDAVLALLCRECISIFDVQGAYIWLIQDQYLVGEVAYGPGADQFPGHRLPLAQTDMLPVSAIKNWRPSYVNHVTRQSVLPPEFLQMTGAKSALAIPLLRADVPVGTLLLVDTQQTAAFGNWLLEQIGLLGVQAALAIQNASLFDVVRRRLDQLRLVNETGRYTTAILSPQNLIDSVAQKLSDILHYDIVSLVQIEDKTLAVNAIFIEGHMYAPEQVAELYDLPTVKQDLIDIAHQAVLHVEPFVSHRPFDLENSTLAVPLIVADEVIGVLIVARRSIRSITGEDLDVLEPLAAQLAISVSNASLFEKVRRQTVELEGRVAQRTEQIRQEQERTEAVLRSVADAVIVFDLNGQVVMTNPVARDLFDAHDLDMDLGTRVQRLVAQALESSATPGNGSATDIIELGAVILQAKAARVVETNDILVGSVVVLRDISQLRKLDRMKDLFVSTVSHELRTPLANLKLYLSLLEQGRQERRADYMHVMDREIERLTRLIDELLQISRLESERHDERPQSRVPVDLENLINGVVQQNAARAERQHKELVCEYEMQPLPLMLGDPDQLVRALTNLVGNAINYTPEGGRISLRCGVAQSPEESVIIEVSDTGIGIPAQDLPTIFERFKRGSNVNSTPGTGLGLAIIKEIVELHQGRIEVESEEGRGSVFRLTFPVHDSG